MIWLLAIGAWAVFGGSSKPRATDYLYKCADGTWSMDSASGCTPVLVYADNGQPVPLSGFSRDVR